MILSSGLSVSGNTKLIENISNKEAKELAYIIDCFNTKKNLDSLIEWKLTKMNDKTILIEKKGQLAFFTFYQDKELVFLHEINYYKGSFQKMIFIDEDSLKEYKITNQTQFRVLMSKDKLSIYFCVINPDKLFIWVLSNGNWVYTSHTILNTKYNQD